MISKLEQRLLRELEQKVKGRYGHLGITFDGYRVYNGDGIGLRVKIPDEDLAITIAEEMAPWSVETLEKTGVLIYVVPLSGGED